MVENKYIEWDDKTYSIGIKKIDDQHKKLVALINILIQNKKSDSEFLEKVLNTLIKYTEDHFADEEAILEKTNYNAFKDHKIQHRNFIRRVKVFSEKYHDDPESDELLDSILSFLRDWLTSHILVHDMAYKKYLLGDD